MPAAEEDHAESQGLGLGEGGVDEDTDKDQGLGQGLGQGQEQGLADDDDDNDDDDDGGAGSRYNNNNSSSSNGKNSKANSHPGGVAATMDFHEVFTGAPGCPDKAVAATGQRNNRSDPLPLLPSLLFPLSSPPTQPSAYIYPWSILVLLSIRIRACTPPPLYTRDPIHEYLHTCLANIFFNSHKYLPRHFPTHPGPQISTHTLIKYHDSMWNFGLWNAFSGSNNTTTKGPNAAAASHLVKIDFSSPSCLDLLTVRPVSVLVRRLPACTMSYQTVGDIQAKYRSRFAS